MMNGDTTSHKIRTYYINKILVQRPKMLREATVVVIVWWLDLQLPVQLVPIATKVVSSNPVHGEVYSMQYYVIKFVSDLRQVGDFLLVLRFPQPIKLTATI